MNGFEQFFANVAKGFVWLGKEIGKGIGYIPKLITLTNDAEKSGAECLPKVLKVVNDAGALAQVTTADSAGLLTDLAALGKAVMTAASNEGVNLAADAAVVTAFQQLIADAKKQSFADAVAAWHQIVEDVHDLDATVLADLKKLEADLAPQAAAQTTSA